MTHLLPDKEDKSYKDAFKAYEETDLKEYLNNQYVFFWQGILGNCNNDRDNQVQKYSILTSVLNSNNTKKVFEGCFSYKEISADTPSSVQNVFLKIASDVNSSSVSNKIVFSMENLTQDQILKFDGKNKTLLGTIKKLNLLETMNDKAIVVADESDPNIAGIDGNYILVPNYYHLDNFQRLLSSFRKALIDKSIIVKPMLLEQASPYVHTYLLKANIKNDDPELKLKDMDTKLAEKVENFFPESQFESYALNYFKVEVLKMEMEIDAFQGNSERLASERYRKLRDTALEALKIRFPHTLDLEDFIIHGNEEFNEEESDSEVINMNSCSDGPCENLFLAPGFYGGNKGVKIAAAEIDFHPLAIIYSPSKTVSINVEKVTDAVIDTSAMPTKKSQPYSFNDYLMAPLPSSIQNGKNVVVNWNGTGKKLFVDSPPVQKSGNNGSNAGKIELNVSDKIYGSLFLIALGGNGEDGHDGMDSRLWDQQNNRYNPLVLQTGRYVQETRNHCARRCWEEPSESDRPRRSRRRCRNVCTTTSVKVWRPSPTKIDIYRIEGGNGGNGGNGGHVVISVPENSVNKNAVILKHGGEHGKNGESGRGPQKNSDPENGKNGLPGNIEFRNI